MDTEIIKKIVNDKFNKIEEKVDTLNDILSKETKFSNINIVYAYITGFFDGEGSIGIYKNKKYDNITLQILLANTNLEVLKRIKSVFKGEINIQKKESENNKKAWVWQPTNRNEMKFLLEKMLPYSIIKKSQIKLSLEFLENITDSRGKNISSEEQKFRELYINKIKEPKHYFYTEEEIKYFNNIIDNTKQSQNIFGEDVYAYCSGIFDGEGTIGAYKNKRNDDNISLQTYIVNTNPLILIGIKMLFGGNIKTVKTKKEKNLNRRQKWVWQTASKDDIKFFLNKIFPYSIVKKSQIELGLKFLETYNYNTQQIIANKLKEMKDEEYTNEEIKILNEQIEEMNIDKLQKTIMDF